jgi:transposase
MSEHSIDLVPNLVRGHRADGRSVYDKAAKRELVRRVLQPGTSLARMAMEHGVNANLLRKWVIELSGTRPPRRLRTVMPALPSASLLPVKTTSAAATAITGEGYLEFILAGVAIRVHGRVDAHTLSTALDCLARRA